MKISHLKKMWFVYLPNLLILAGILFFAVPFYPIVRDEVWYFFKQITNKSIELDMSGKPDGNSNQTSVFGKLLSSAPIKITPVNTNFSLVIEKINLNAPIVADVPITDENAYKAALQNGIAHASVSQYPSKDPGNVYLFAHASVDFWELGKYASVFNLLRKLEIGDKVNVFFKGKRFVYKVVNKEILSGWNTYPITRTVVEPTLTLQTCDPPGTTLNRLVITAVLSDANGI